VAVVVPAAGSSGGFASGAALVGESRFSSGITLRRFGVESLGSGFRTLRVMHFTVDRARETYRFRL